MLESGQSPSDLLRLRLMTYCVIEFLTVHKEGDSGVKCQKLRRKHGILAGPYYASKAKFGGVEVDEARGLRGLKDENRRVKQRVAELNPGALPFPPMRRPASVAATCAPSSATWRTLLSPTLLPAPRY